jgi:hypothetical protein
MWLRINVNEDCLSANADPLENLQLSDFQFGLIN